MPGGHHDPEDVPRDGLEADAFDAVTFTDDELERLALDARPFDPFGADVEPFESPDQHRAIGLLPDWYMPAPSLWRRRKQTYVFAGIAIALLTVNVGGFCVTYGFPEFVWH